MSKDIKTEENIRESNNEHEFESLDKPKKTKGGGLKAVVVILVIVIIVLAILYAVSLYTNWDILGVKKSLTQTPTTTGLLSNWQAVFLSNGQVYFGHLKNINSDYPELSDIYYLQVQEVPIQPAQPATTEEEGVQPAQQTEQRLILVKFGTELHRPADVMYLNKDHILFFEDLTSDSPVVSAIEDYQAGLTTGQQ